jgi:hypothetical protein
VVSVERVRFSTGFSSTSNHELLPFRCWRNIAITLTTPQEAALGTPQRRNWCNRLTTSTTVLPLAGEGRESLIEREPAFLSSCASSGGDILLVFVLKKSSLCLQS